MEIVVMCMVIGIAGILQRLPDICTVIPSGIGFESLVEESIVIREYVVSAVKTESGATLYVPVSVMVLALESNRKRAEVVSPGFASVLIPALGVCEPLPADVPTESHDTISRDSMLMQKNTVSHSRSFMIAPNIIGISYI
jgi:hypothetical protein